MEVWDTDLRFSVRSIICVCVRVCACVRGCVGGVHKQHRDETILYFLHAGIVLGESVVCRSELCPLL